MNKEEFLKKTLIEQVNYFNERMEQGESIRGISKNLGINKAITIKFEKHNYKLINGKYILEQIEGQESKKNEVDTNTLPQEEPITREPIKTKGRPSRPNRLKTNITLDAKVKEELQIYCIRQRIALSDLLEKLALEFLQK